MKYRLPPVNAQPMIALGPDAVLIADGWAGKSVADVQSDDERSLLALVDGKRTVADILRVSRMSGFVTMRQLRSLSERKIIRTVVPKRAETSSFGRTTARFGPPKAGATQDLTAVAHAFTPPAYDTPTPLPTIIAPPQLPPRQAPRRATPVQVPPAKITIEVVSPASSSSPSTALVPTSRVVGRPITSPPKLGPMAAQAVELWFSLTRRDWSTLVLVPGHKAGSALPFAAALAEAGSAIRRKPVELFSAEGKDLIPTTDWIFPRQPGDQFQRIIALDPVGLNPMGIPVAQGAQVVLVVVDRGEADLSTVRRTVEAIGRAKVTGSVLLTPAKPIKLR
jgi:hypothetical protein